MGKKRIISMYIFNLESKKIKKNSSMSLRMKMSKQLAWPIAMAIFLKNP